MPSRRLGQHRRRSGRRRGGRARACARRPRAGPGLRALRLPSLSVSETTPHGALHQARIRGAPLALLDQHQLGRSAADVEDQRRPVAGLEQLVAAEHREPRFLLRRDDVERDPGLVAHPLDELAAVARRGGRPRSRPSATARRCAAAACRRRSPSAPTARSIASSRQPAGLRQPLAQPDDARESVDDGEAAVARAGDQQPAIVGAEVDRAIGVAVMLPPRRRSWFRRPALLACLCSRAGALATPCAMTHARFCPSPRGSRRLT